MKQLWKSFLVTITTKKTAVKLFKKFVLKKNAPRLAGEKEKKKTIWRFYFFSSCLIERPSLSPSIFIILTRT